MYDHQDDTTYLGKILIQFKMEAMKHTGIVDKSIGTIPALPFDDKVFWDEEIFLIEGLFPRGDFISTSSSNLKLNMKCSSRFLINITKLFISMFRLIFIDTISNSIELYLRSYESAKNLKYFIQEEPFQAVYLKCLMTDVRLKFEAFHFFRIVSRDIKIHLSSYKLYQLKHPKQYGKQIKCLKDLLTAFQKVLEEKKGKIIYKGHKKLTDTDKFRYNYVKEFIVSI